jgi:hypothetical protein
VFDPAPFSHRLVVYITKLQADIGPFVDTYSEHGKLSFLTSPTFAKRRYYAYEYGGELLFADALGLLQSVFQVSSDTVYSVLFSMQNRDDVTTKSSVLRAFVELYDRIQSIASCELSEVFRANKSFGYLSLVEFCQLVYHLEP